MTVAGRTAGRAIATVAVAGVLACEPGRPVDSTYTVLDSAGIRIVVSAAPAWLPDESWTVDSAPALSIGTVDGAQDHQFSGIRALAELVDGSVIVANGADQQLRAFDGAGRFRWRFGQRGQGPGDFQSITAIAPYATDSLLVYDNWSKRYTVLSSDGRLVRDWRIEPPAEIDYFRSLLFAGLWPDGSIALTYQPVRRGMTPPQRTRRPTTLYRHVRATGETTPLVTSPGAEAWESPRLGEMQRMPHGRDSHFAMAADGLVVGDNERYELQRRRLDGSIAFIFRRTGNLVPLSGEELARERQRIIDERRVLRERQFRGMPDSIFQPMSALEDRTLAEMPFPETYPAFGRLVIAGDGHVWVQEYDPRGDSLLDGSSWSVFHPNGHWLGNVRLPARFALRVATSDHVLGTWTDENGVEFVRRYAVRTRPR